LGEEVVINGVKIIGIENLPGTVAINASQMYSSNILNLIKHFWDGENKTFKLDLEDEIMKGCLITHDGEIVNETIKNLK
jgi:NAD(P) transhydrogenase subunit alpha